MEIIEKNRWWIKNIDKWLQTNAVANIDKKTKEKIEENFQSVSNHSDEQNEWAIKFEVC